MNCQVKGCNNSPACAVTFDDGAGRPNFEGPEHIFHDPPISMEFVVCLHHAGDIASGEFGGRIMLTEEQITKITKDSLKE